MSILLGLHVPYPWKNFEAGGISVDKPPAENTRQVAGTAIISSCMQSLSAGGLREITLQNERVSLTVLPDAGGKVAGFIDRRSGRDWLWQNRHIPLGNARYDVDYGRDLDSGGWDEVLLSLSPSELTFGDGLPRHIPDHGDVVGQRWRLVEAGVNDAGDAACEISVSGQELGYRFTRRIVLPEGRPYVQVRYVLQNRDAFSLPWYWSLHALLSAAAGWRVDLPAGQEYRVEQRSDEAGNTIGPGQAWPSLPAPGGGHYDLARFFDEDAQPAGTACKIFVRSPPSGQVSVRAGGNGECLTMRFDPAELPWLGLWLNNRGWSGCDSEPYVNLGVEPSTIGYDCVSRAVDDGSLVWLEPGETREWAITLELAA